MEIGSLIGGWRVVDVPYVGRAASVARVCRADDPREIAALKLCTDPDGRSVDRLEAEILNMEREPLPGRMPRLLGKGRREGLPYFVMTFSRDIDAGAKSVGRAVGVTLFLLDCAAELREKGLVHCDLKPENVGIEAGRDGIERYVLRDWATCREMADANVRQATVGTRYYRSQEVDYAGVCGERSEIHAIGMSFLALLPFARWVVYAPVILLAISPHVPPFVQARTFEDLRRRVVRAPGAFRRLVYLWAAVWKTKVVAWRAVAALGAVAAAAAVAFLCHRHARSAALYERHLKDEAVHGRDLSKALVAEGIADYLSGKWESAFESMDRGMRSGFYDPKDHEDVNVEAIYEDCRRRAGH